MEIDNSSKASSHSGKFIVAAIREGKRLFEVTIDENAEMAMDNPVYEGSHQV